MKLLGFEITRATNALKSNFNYVALKQEKTGNELLVKITQEFKDRSRKNIDEWRDALEAADYPESPKWYLLQDLFDYLSVDTHASSQIDLRKAATSGSRFYIYSKQTMQENEEKTALLQTSWFYEFMNNVLDSVPRAYTLLQLVDANTMRFDLIPRRNIVPQKNLVLFSISDEKGINFKDPAFASSIIWVKSNYYYGLFNDLVPQILWKRNAQQSWAEVSEKFGHPMVTATTNKRDKKELDKIDAALAMLGEASTAVFPEGTTIKIEETGTKTDPFNLFDKQIERCNGEMSKRIIGGTMISDNGSSRSQSEVHQGNFDEKIAEADRRMIEFTVNDQLLPMLIANKKGFTVDDAFTFDRSEEISLKDHWDIIEAALNHYELDDDWVSKHFNIPIVSKKIPIPPTPPNNGNANFKEASTALAAALEANGFMLPNYPVVTGLPIATFLDDLLSELADELINNIWKGEDTLINEVLRSIASYGALRGGLFDGWSNRMEISYDTPDVHCLSMMEYNLFEFSRLKEKANVFALNQLLLDKEKNNITTEKEFRDQALQYLQNPDVNYLNTERNHAIAVGQNASRYHQFKSEEDTITNLVQWQTVGDSRVRASHALMDNRIFDLKDSSGLSIWPPKEWGCRCEMIQYTGKRPASVTTNNEGLQLLKVAKDSKWNVNRGVTEQVFTANEMYMKNNGFITKEASELTFEKYNLPKFDKTKNDHTPLKLDATITPENVHDLFKGDDKNNMPFADYLNRQFILTEDNFNVHTKGKYVKPNENRHQLFPHIEDVLKEPDEVYFTKKNKDYQTSYVKFYNGEALVVNTQVYSKTVEVNSWFYMKDEKRVRSGYQIYKNKKS